MHVFVVSSRQPEEDEEIDDEERIFERHRRKSIEFILKGTRHEQAPGTSGDSQEAEFERSLPIMHFTIIFIQNKQGGAH